jgi:hypothetical protein
VNALGFLLLGLRLRLVVSSLRHKKVNPRNKAKDPLPRKYVTLRHVMQRRPRPGPVARQMAGFKAGGINAVGLYTFKSVDPQLESA